MRMDGLSFKGHWKAWLAGTLILAASGVIWAGIPQDIRRPLRRVARTQEVGTEGPLGVLTPKQKSKLMKSQFEKIKGHADELVSLSKSLQDDVNNSNENVFPLGVIGKAEKIEKLAKKIRQEVQMR
jgi:hypothetical protein